MCTHFLKNVYKQWSRSGFIMSVTEIKALFITTQHSIQWKTLQIKRRVAFKNHLERGKQNAICYKKQRTIKRVEKNAKVTKSALEHGKHNTILLTIIYDCPNIDINHWPTAARFKFFFLTSLKKWCTEGKKTYELQHWHFWCELFLFSASNLHRYLMDLNCVNEYA